MYLESLTYNFIDNFRLLIKMSGGREEEDMFNLSGSSKDSSTDPDQLLQE